MAISAPTVMRIAPAIRRHGTAWSASLIVHLGALAVAGWIGITAPDTSELAVIESAWSPEILDLALMAEPVAQTGNTSFSPGGKTANVDETSDVADAVVPTLRPVLHAMLSPLDVASPSWSRDDLASIAGGLRNSHGEGTRAGEGEGAGSGFFGIPFQLGRRIVYVVDNSLSMNHKHDGPMKTRFKRVQMELVNSIWQMQPEQQFYVIFFNRETAAMPDRMMQHATWGAKERYLTWVAEMKTSGAPTDPRQAMELALAFQPDIIYFLTDGEFSRAANRWLLQLKQSRTAIHTFSFGEKLSEGVLVDIAKSNQGQYTYIP